MILQVVFFMMFCLRLLVKEVPTQSKTQYALIERIVWR